MLFQTFDINFVEYHKIYILYLIASKFVDQIISPMFVLYNIFDVQLAYFLTMQMTSVDSIYPLRNIFHDL